MNLKALKKPQLLELAKELRLDVTDALRKPELIQAILAVGADDDELSECIEAINDRETAKRQAAEAEAERQREERERQKQEQQEERRREHELLLDRENLQHELEMKCLDVEASRPRRQSGGSVQSAATERPTLRMCDLMRPYKVGEDIGLFLVNFERTCERAQFSRDSWPQKLLTLLPGEASDVMARLPKEEAQDYQKVKSSFLRKYRLSAEGFRQKFREAEKARGESYSEFAYKLRANLEEWLKEAEAFGEHDKVVECFGLEQFYRRLPENLRLWVQDRPGVSTMDQAAQLADEFVARRGAQGPKDGHKEFRPRPDKSGPKGRAPQEDGGARKVVVGDRETGHDNEKRAADAEEQRRKRAFEARRQAACYYCGETGHFAASCKKGKLVFHVLDPDEDSRQRLEPYVRELAVNGKPCRVRDSAATMDVVHPSYVEPHQFTGDCAWIKQAVEAQGVCLPIARIIIDGPFGKLETGAAVSPSLPAQYPYLFSNRSDQLLRERVLVFGEGIVFALTRSKARELGAKVAVESRKDSRREEVGKLAETSTDVASERGQSASLRVQIAGVEQHPAETDDSPAEIFVAPKSESLERLLRVDRWEILTDRFGRTELLVDDHVDSLLAIALIQSSTQVARLRDLYEQVQFRTGCLESLSVPPSEYAVILNRVLMRSVPEDLAVQYRQRMRETASDANAEATPGEEQVKSIMAFLKVQHVLLVGSAPNCHLDWDLDLDLDLDLALESPLFLEANLEFLILHLERVQAVAGTTVPSRWRATGASAEKAGGEPRFDFSFP
ncbi:uncharacterized protein LOC144156323 [Haemaphysalis longicornis]